jgi:hypothetical protein
MNVAPVSHGLTPAIQVAHAPRAVPARHDRDGDHNANKIEPKPSEAAATAKGGHVLNVKA